MLDIRPPRVILTEGAVNHPEAFRRAQRIISALGYTKVETPSDAELDRMAPSLKSGVCWGEIENPIDPVLVLNIERFIYGPERALRDGLYPNLNKEPVGDSCGFVYRPDGEPWSLQERGNICQSAFEMHSIIGCPFRCAYCSLGGVINMRLNIEEFVSHLDEWLKIAPQQKIYKWDNATDISCFEPEFGATEILIDYFSKKDDKYLLLYTGKSDNVDFMLDFDHRGKTIVCWSFSPRTQSTLIEPRTASWDARVESARKCQEAGYPVRFRFSPIIPVKNWQEEYSELIGLIFGKTRPDIITLCMFGWMDIEKAKRCIDFSLLDPDCVAAMYDAADELKGKRYGPISFEWRKKIYRFLIDEIRRLSKDTAISICLDTPGIWQVFGKELQTDPASYFCNCGSHCTPRKVKGCHPVR